MNNYKIKYKQGGYQTPTQGQNPKLMKTLAAKGGYRYENGGLNEAQLLARQQHAEAQALKMEQQMLQQQQLHKNYVPPSTDMSGQQVLASDTLSAPSLGQTLMLDGGVRKYEEGGQGVVPKSMYGNRPTANTSSIVYEESSLDKLNEEEKKLEEVKVDESWKNEGILRKQKQAMGSLAMTGLSQGTKFGFDEWAKNKGFDNYQKFRDSQKAIRDAAAITKDAAVEGTSEVATDAAGNVITDLTQTATKDAATELAKTEAIKTTAQQTGTKTATTIAATEAEKKAAELAAAELAKQTALKEAAKTGTQEVVATTTAEAGKEIVKTGATKTAEEIAKETALNLAKTAGKKTAEEIAKEGVKEGTKDLLVKTAAEKAKEEAAKLALQTTTEEVVKTAGTELGQEVVKEGAKETVKGATNLNPYALGANLVGKGISMGSDDQDSSTWKAGEVTGDLLGDMGEYAGYGSMFGPWGTAIGAGVGLTKGLFTGFSNLAKGKEEKAVHEREVEQAYVDADIAESETKRYSGFDFGDNVISKYGGYRMQGGGVRPLMRPRAMSINRY
tara:strand:- start:532 stop:2205 length:1674 start_codon:yes stop_codon:yes gene_type:complete